MFKSQHAYLLPFIVCCLIFLGDAHGLGMVPKPIWQHLNSPLPYGLQLLMLLMCFSFPPDMFFSVPWMVQAARTRYCGSLRLSEILPSAQEPSSRGLDWYFLVAFSQRGEKAVLSKLVMFFSVLRWLLSRGWEIASLVCVRHGEKHWQEPTRDTQA